MMTSSSPASMSCSNRMLSCILHRTFLVFALRATFPLVTKQNSALWLQAFKYLQKWIPENRTSSFCRHIFQDETYQSVEVTTLSHHRKLLIVFIPIVSRSYRRTTLNLSSASLVLSLFVNKSRGKRVKSNFHEIHRQGLASPKRVCFEHVCFREMIHRFPPPTPDYRHTPIEFQLHFRRRRKRKMT